MLCMPGKEEEVNVILAIERGLNYLAVQSTSVIKVSGWQAFI